MQKELINLSYAQQSNHAILNRPQLPRPFPEASNLITSSRNEPSTIPNIGANPPENSARLTNLTGLLTNNNSNIIATKLDYSNLGNTTFSNFSILYISSHGNQLLFPMISPTEGLIYKPCTFSRNGGYMYIEPYSSIENMKRLFEFNPNLRSCVVDEKNLGEVKDTNLVNSTPDNHKENSILKNVLPLFPTSPKS